MNDCVMLLTSVVPNFCFGTVPLIFALLAILLFSNTSMLDPQPFSLKKFRTLILVLNYKQGTMALPL